MATMTSFLPVNNAARGPGAAHPHPHPHPMPADAVPSFHSSTHTTRPKPSAPFHSASPPASAAAPFVSSPLKQNAKMEMDPAGPRAEQRQQLLPPEPEVQQQQQQQPPQTHHVQSQQQTQGQLQVKETQQESNTDNEVKEEPARASTSSLSGTEAAASAVPPLTTNRARRHSDEFEHHSSEEHQDEAGSDRDPEEGDGDEERPAKRKKGQRFFCTDFPPCNLSFTRSEHLARHIRKHTGERPFQCFCTRRFSRLDNLRQHAQTVHVNEEIPPDSLAASVTRMARPVRTDRVRPSGGRARAGTAGHQPGSGRGSHRRNLSGSTMPPQLASYNEEAARHRQPPLVAANDPSSRAKLTVDTSAGSPPRTPPGQVQGFTGFSPAAPPPYYTPSSSSARYSAFPSAEAPSPYFTSPASSTSAFFPDTTPRRLSFPTGARPFDISYPAPYPPTSYAQGPQAPPPRPPPQQNTTQQPTTDPAYSAGGSAGYLPSPPSSQAPSQEQSSSDSDWRRRTWHAPSSSLSALGRQSMSGSFLAPAAAAPTSSTFSGDQQAQGRPGSEQQTPPRLPGIESFDLAQSQPTAPPRRAPTPMQIDSSAPSRPAPPSSSAESTTLPPGPGSRPAQPVPGRGHHRRGNVSIDTALQSHLTRLDLRSGSQDTSAAASQWGESATPASAAGPTASRAYHPPLQPMPAATSQQEPSASHHASSHDRSQSWVGGATLQQPPTAGGPPRDTTMTGMQSARPVPVAEQQPASEGGATGFYQPQVERRHSYVPPEYLPRQPPAPQQQGTEPHPTSASERDSLDPLRALVAVATSESEKQQRESAALPPRSSA